MSIQDFNDFLQTIEKAKIYIHYDSCFQNPRLEARWCTGGISGGNCYGEVASFPVAGEPEVELEALDQILELMCPKITWLQWRALERECLKRYTTSDSDYYGNYNNYAVKEVNLLTLYNYLMERQLISD